MTETGFKLLKRFEGLRLRPYRDVAGYWTVGYGHKLGDGKVLRAEDNRVWTIEEVNQLLLDDVGIAQRAVVNAVKVPLNKYQRDALTSFAFNLGITAFKNSTLLKLLNLGQYDMVPGQLMRWVRAKRNGVMRVEPGLVTRRKAEAALWNTPYP